MTIKKDRFNLENEEGTMVWGYPDAKSPSYRSIRLFPKDSSFGKPLVFGIISAIYVSRHCGLRIVEIDQEK